MGIFERAKIGTVKILSIDGGGVRGLVPSIFLEELENRLGKMGKSRLLYRRFHLIAGTSTGGLIALGLSTPRNNPAGRHVTEPVLTAADMAEIYRRKASWIFPYKKNGFRSRIGHIVRNKYRDINLSRLLRETFKDATLQDALTHILITSYDTEAREPRFFKKSNGIGHPNFYIRDVARATVAAPTYFSPAHIRAVSEEGRSYSLVDGGLFANNPALNAYIEARKLYPWASRYVVVSLGTGSVDRPYKYDELKNWGYVEWVSALRGFPLGAMMVDGQSDSAVDMLTQLPKVKLYRMDFQLDESNAPMDDSSRTNLLYLERKARELVEQNEKTIETLSREL
jgi:patatin-like phospholipase/acyl hydrolase